MFKCYRWKYFWVAFGTHFQLFHKFFLSSGAHVTHVQLVPKCKGKVKVQVLCFEKVKRRNFSYDSFNQGKTHSTVRWFELVKLESMWFLYELLLSWAINWRLLDMDKDG